MRDAAGLTVREIVSADQRSLLVELRGELGWNTVAALREQASWHADEIVVRLENLEFMDSSGLAWALQLRASHPAGIVRFEGAAGEVRAMLERTGTLQFMGS